MTTKRILTCFLIGTFITFQTSAQNIFWKAPQISEEAKHFHAEKSIVPYINELPVADPNNQLQSAPASRSASSTTTQIGDTKYDLQTNTAIQRRILNHGNGNISAVWTYSNDNAWTTRGTGYNFYNGSAWGSLPTSEIETERVGWPNILTTGTGKEIIIAHSTANNILRKTERNSVGTGSWTEANQTSLDLQWWSRASVAGNNDNTIHLIGLTMPIANGGSLYNGMDGALLYARSTNSGATWGITNYQLPTMTATYFPTGVGADSYSLDAKGNTVAIVYGGLGTGVQLWKSTNGGVSWTKKDVLIPEGGPFDEATTYIPGVFDSAMYSSDGTVHVLIDDNNDCHVWFGRQFLTNETINDGLIGYYPFTNSLDYWNESFPENAPVSLTGALDVNNNGILDVIGNTAAVLGGYRFNGLAGFPSAGIDDDGCIYLTYAAVREDLNNGSQHYRHTYLMKSCDYGCTWTFPEDITGDPANNFAECVFPSIARKVDSSVHVIYQLDNEPGIAVSGDMDPVVVNKIFYFTEEGTAFDSIGICPTEIFGDTLLCPGASLDLLAHGCANSYTWSTGATTQTITVTSTGTYTVTFATDCGNQVVEHTVVAPTGSGGPAVQLQASKLVMCAGDTSMISANSSTAGSGYLWSTGATSQTITVNLPGTYTVTVTDCVGSTTKTIQIIEPTTAPVAMISGNSTICSGANSTLTALPVTGGSYLWSTGATTQSTSITGAGTYTLQVTNCGGQSTATFVVTAEPAPVAEIVATDSIVCAGENITLTASGGIAYSWSNGNTGASVTLNQVSQSGTYTVTVSNDCGDTDTEEIVVNILPLPATPTITFNGTAYVSSSQTGNQWYLNGTLVPGATGQTFSGSIAQGDILTVIVTDGNGCSAESSGVVGVDNLGSLSSKVSIYPNPSTGIVTVNFSDLKGPVALELTNLAGQILYTQQLNEEGSQMLDLSEIASGVYQLRITHDGSTMVDRLVLK